MFRLAGVNLNNNNNNNMAVNNSEMKNRLKKTIPLAGRYNLSESLDISLPQQSMPIQVRVQDQ
jgi:hypothetical protein